VAERQLGLSEWVTVAGSGRPPPWYEELAKRGDRGSASWPGHSVRTAIQIELHRCRKQVGTTVRHLLEVFMIIAIVHGNDHDGHPAMCHRRRGVFSPGHGDRQFCRGSGPVVSVLEFTEAGRSGVVAKRLLSMGFIDTVSRVRYRR
jgi:hypothetical protein